MVMSKLFYGKPMTRDKKRIIIAMFVPFIILDLLSLFIGTEAFWALTLSLSSIPICAMIMLMMDQGPAFWKWWVSFGLGHTIEIPDEAWFYEDDYEIQEWLKENIKRSYHTIKPCHTYLFLFKKDAFAFKMRWF